MTSRLIRYIVQIAGGALAGLAMSATVAAAQDGSTLAAVKEKGYLQCGVSQGLPGFSNPNDAGDWSGIDVDLCRAIAAAIFGSADDNVKYTPLSAKERFTALQSKEIDVLSRNTTWTLDRDTSLGANFAGVNYYDGQGFMVRKDLGISSAMELSGAAVCTNTGTTTELNAADFFRTNDMDYTIVAFEKADEVVGAYDAGRCDVYTTDQSGLYAQRLKLKDPDAHKVLPEIISKEPLGPAVRQGDDNWLDVVAWTLNAMVAAEELGVTAANVDDMVAAENPAIRRLLGVEGALGENMGLDNKWAYYIIKEVGNYGESFERNLGPGSGINIERGLNKLWTDGGLQYSPPIR